MAFDHVQAYFRESLYKTPELNVLESYHLAVPRLLLDFIAGRKQIVRPSLHVLFPSLFPLPRPLLPLTFSPPPPRALFRRFPPPSTLPHQSPGPRRPPLHYHPPKRRLQAHPFLPPRAFPPYQRLSLGSPPDMEQKHVPPEPARDDSAVALGQREGHADRGDPGGDEVGGGEGPVGDQSGEKKVAYG